MSDFPDQYRFQYFGRFINPLSPVALEIQKNGFLSNLRSDIRFLIDSDLDEAHQTLRFEIRVKECSSPEEARIRADEAVVAAVDRTNGVGMSHYQPKFILDVNQGKHLVDPETPELAIDRPLLTA